MAKTASGVKIDSVTARAKLRVSKTVRYVDLADGLHLGYRKGHRDGRWVVRRYAGAGRYEVETIGRADDTLPADGVSVLTFRQAQEMALRHRLVGEPTAPIRPAPAPVPAPPAVPTYTVADAVREYLEFKLAEGAKSFGDSRLRVDALIEPALGKIAVDQLKPDEIQAWKHKLATTPARLRVKPGEEQRFADLDLADPEALRKRRATANRTLTILKAALNLAWRDGKVASDNAWRRVKRFRGVDIPRSRYLRLEETQRLISVCRGDFRLLVQGALLTGARYGELTRFEVQDFDATAGTLRVRLSKSGKWRHIILTDEGVQFFAALAEGRDPTDLFFTRAGKAWKPTNQGKWMRAAVNAASLGDDVSFHTLRHTWASLAVMNGVPLLVVAQNLGHVDTRMVERHYGHLTQSYKAQMIRAHGPSFGIMGEAA